ncbi:hypothetical protein OBBRIDRAFT_880642 [Obba rivulosa]|uniref:Uncharacterized protein n=1 Tax=Obba rivulosa TaxID=1052685 RepID=A0A8E2DK80_9APHY|nr:hypothetical protein OBBRIDRAFT_880642 [Obba rivulosa]
MLFRTAMESSLLIVNTSLNYFLLSMFWSSSASLTLMLQSGTMCRRITALNSPTLRDFPVFTPDTFNQLELVLSLKKAEAKIDCVRRLLREDPSPAEDGISASVCPTP